MKQTGFLTREQHQLINLFSPLALLAAIIGTFYVAQYRITTMEKTLESLQMSNLRLIQDMAVVKDRLGIQSARQSQPIVSLPLDSQTTQMQTSPSAQLQQSQEQSIIVPTPQPTPTPIAPSIDSIIGELL